ncbi:MAG: class I SAM-dependent methyltransferase [Aeromonas sp.]
MSTLCCPLCAKRDHYPLQVAQKTYYRCRHCALVWLDSAFYLDSAAEKAVYDGHDNQINDPRYRAFLSRTWQQVSARFTPPANGLDFGCGPGPALLAMAQEAGFTMWGFDKFYANDAALLQQSYDFITCTEVIEHIAAPREVLEGLWAQLRPNGILVLQTQQVLDDARFATWRYRHDPTHIVFFARDSFVYLANAWQCALHTPHPDVVVLIKPSA